jgi:hypothetical protein
MRTSLLSSSLVLVLALSGCPSAPAPTDSATGMDAGSTPDTGGSPVIDSGHDAASPMRPDTNVDGGVAPGCDPTLGIECDGDWDGRCTPACTTDQCCSPQHGAFACVARNADGSCPLGDLFIDQRWIDGTRGTYEVSYRTFAADACEIMEGCVDAPGTRRLLRWDTYTPNQGMADMFLGITPARGVSSGPFEWSACHGHHHFTSYAHYDLVAGDGSVAATGHKQAFCLEDYYVYPCGGTGEPRCVGEPPTAVYNCGNQGIQMGWQDSYWGTGSNPLPCQWIDITDVPAGDYTLNIDINTEHILAESDYSNNHLEISVTIPAPPPDNDVTMACSTRTSGADRDCGLTRSSDPGVGTCTPGASVTLGCSTGCGLGSCTGDTVLRVCDGSHDPTCTAREAIAQNDDSGCPGTGRCGSSGDCCSQVTFTCPASGTYAAFWGAYTSGDTATCTLAAR